MLKAGGRMAGVSDLAQTSRRATAKQRFLDQTEVLRSKLAAEHRRAAERTALASIESDLTTLWADGDAPASSIRREKIFQRWDDCVELPEDREVSSVPAAVRVIGRDGASRRGSASTFRRTDAMASPRGNCAT